MKRLRPASTEMRSKLLICALAVTAGVSCTSASTPQRVTLERMACYGTCPAYRLTVSSDGAVRYEGAGWSNSISARSAPEIRLDSARLSPARAAAVLAAFERGWSRWQPNRYYVGTATCPAPATDHAEVLLVRARGARQDTLGLYAGCPMRPARITRAAAEIDSIAGVIRWLGPEPRRRPAA